MNILNSKKNILTVFIEGLVVGGVSISLVYLVHFIINLFYKIENINITNYLIIFISGFLFHIIFEYIGLNESYCIDYYKLLQ